MAKLEKLTEQAKEHLEPGEETLEIVMGTYEAKMLGRDDIARSGIFVATDRRLVFYAKKMTGYDLEVFPYENISSIEMGKNMMGHHISLFASGNNVEMKWIDKKQDVPAFISAVKARMKGGAASAAPAGGASDSADQIRKLAELRDEGILTEEEFQAKKTQLLGI
jgi:hypothetical protein